MNAIPNFPVSFKNGLNVNLPSYIDKKVFDEWVDGMKVIFQKDNKHNYLVACIDESGDNRLYMFMRFFSLGDKTECSIDFQCDGEVELFEKLTILLSDKFGG